MQVNVCWLAITPALVAVVACHFSDCQRLTELDYFEQVYVTAKCLVRIVVRIPCKCKHTQTEERGRVIVQAEEKMLQGDNSTGFCAGRLAMGCKAVGRLTGH